MLLPFRTNHRKSRQNPQFQTPNVIRDRSRPNSILPDSRPIQSGPTAQDYPPVLRTPTTMSEPSISQPPPAASIGTPHGTPGWAMRPHLDRSSSRPDYSATEANVRSFVEDLEDFNEDLCKLIDEASKVLAKGQDGSIKEFRRGTTS